MKITKAKPQVETKTEPKVEPKIVKPKATKKSIPKEEKADYAIRVEIGKQSGSSGIDYTYKVMEPVQSPNTSLKDGKVFPVGTYPNQPKTLLPNPFPELPEKVKSYLNLYPYGDNIIINQRLATKLMKFFFSVRDIPMPNTLQEKFDDFMKHCRELLNMISEEEVNERRQKEMGEFYEPIYLRYQCKCANKKRKVKK